MGERLELSDTMPQPLPTESSTDLATPKKAANAKLAAAKQVRLDQLTTTPSSILLKGAIESPYDFEREPRIAELGRRLDLMDKLLGLDVTPASKVPEVQD